MTSDLNRALARLSREELEHLLAVKGEIEQLETRRDALQRELQDVEAALEKLVGGAGATGRKSTARTAASRKKTTGKAGKKPGAKKPARKTAKKVAGEGGKTAAKKTAAKKTAAKKTARKAAKKGAGRRGSSGGAGTLEDVIVRVLQEQGEPMSFKALLESIVMNKLFVSRSKNFDNVLRRTLSTSDRVKRVARGVYAV